MEPKKNNHANSTHSHEKPMSSRPHSTTTKLNSWITQHRSTIVGSVVLVAGLLCFLGMFGVIEQLLGSIPYLLLLALGLVLVYLGLRMLGFTTITGPIDRKINKLRDSFFKK